MRKTSLAALLCWLIPVSTQSAPLDYTSFVFTYYGPSFDIGYADYSEPPGSDPTVRTRSGSGTTWTPSYELSFGVEEFGASNPFLDSSISKPFGSGTGFELGGARDFLFYSTGSDISYPNFYGFSLSFNGSGDIAQWNFAENQGFGDTYESSSGQGIFTTGFNDGVRIEYYDAILAEIYDVESFFSTSPGYWVSSKACSKGGESADCPSENDEVSYIPVPAAGWLLIVALGGLGLLRGAARQYTQA